MADEQPGSDAPAAGPHDRSDASDDWSLTPAVDPWAGRDTPWEAMAVAPEVLPPTRIEPPVSPDPVAAPPAAPEPAFPPRPRRRAKPARRTPPARKGPPTPTSAPPRPRRRWPRNLAVFTLFTALCCCGVPALVLLPTAGQHPVTAELPDSIADLNLRDDAVSKRAARRLSEQLSSPSAFAGIYTDGNGKRVTIFGITGLRLTPEQDAETQIQRLAADYDIRDVRPYDLGEAGVHERCGIGRAFGASVVVCVWADHGSLATVLSTRRSIADSAELTGRLRNAVLIKG